MSSAREQVLAALFVRLQILASAHVKVYRNMDKPQKIDGGLIIMRDGESEEPEVMLSPLTYIYQHHVPIEVTVQNADASTRDSQLDNLLSSIGNIINNNRNLGFIAEWVEPSAPVFLDEPIEGAASVKMAQLNIMVRFSTNDPLN